MSELDQELRMIRGQLDRRIAQLQEEAQQAIKDYNRLEDSAFRKYDKRRCPQCEGTGATQRIDAGYMKRFGLREWNGCMACGGDGNETRGLGYLDA